MRVQGEGEGQGQQGHIYLGRSSRITNHAAPPVLLSTPAVVNICTHAVVLTNSNHDLFIPPCETGRPMHDPQAHLQAPLARIHIPNPIASSSGRHRLPQIRPREQ